MIAITFTMRVLVVTSSVTFVPENYNRLICRLATHPSVVGLLEINNREKSILVKAIGMIASLSAPRMGVALLKNYLGKSRLIRKNAFEETEKFYRVISNINDPANVKFIQDQKIDLIINARTRSIFRADILNCTRLGCLNIHHGLLPDQRGLMCDFWAHLENEPFGFSIHQMTTKIDDGPIVRVQEVQTDRSCYLKSILKTSEIEAAVCLDLLSQIQTEGKITPIQVQNLKIKYRKNPSLWDGFKMQKKGIRI